MKIILKFIFTIMFVVIFIKPSFSKDISSLYTILLDKKDKQFIIEYKFKNLNKDSLKDVFIPEWVPGNYEKLNFYKSFFDLEFRDENNIKLDFNLVSNNTWRISTNKANFITIKYKVKNSTEPFLVGNLIENNKFFLNPASIFIIAKDLQKEPVSLEILNLEKNDIITTNLDKKDSKYYSDSYLDFIDSPFLVGKYKNYIYKQKDSSFNVSFISDTYNYNYDEIIENIKKITDFQLNLFKDKLDKEYNFFIYLSNEKGNLFKSGGMEHLYSSVIVLPHSAFKAFPDSLFELVSHEFFHHWNAKLIKPEELENIDLTQKYVINNLWFTEGVTNYYSAITLLETGINSKEEYNTKLYKKYSFLFKHSKMNNLYFDDVFSLDQKFDYLQVYLKGELICIALDNLIRNTSNNKNSFDDIMVYLMQNKILNKKNLKDAFATFNIKNIDCVLSDNILSVIPKILYSSGLDLEKEKKKSEFLFAESSKVISKIQI